MLAHKQQDIQATRSGPEPSIDPMTLERLKEAIGDLTPILASEHRRYLHSVESQ